MRKGTFIRTFTCAFTILIALLFFVPAREVEAATEHPYELEDLAITIDVDGEGSLNMTYDVTCHVINDSQGAVNSMEIPILNSDVDDITALSDNIKKAEFEDKSNGRIRIEFKDDHYMGDTFSFSFSYVQYNAFVEKNDVVTYDYTLGWSQTIPIDSYTLKWNADNVTEVTPDAEITDGYYIWNGSLSGGAKDHMKVTYPDDAYAFKNHYVTHKDSNLNLYLIFIIPGCVVAMIVLVIKNFLFKRDFYKSL